MNVLTNRPDIFISICILTEIQIGFFCLRGTTRKKEKDEEKVVVLWQKKWKEKKKRKMIERRK